MRCRSTFAAASLAAMLGAAAPALAQPEPRPTLFESDMSRMTGMTASDPMAGMAMPSWSFMAMGIARLQYNHQGGPSGDEAHPPRLRVGGARIGTTTGLD